MSRLVNLRELGRMTWAGAERGWVARPDDVVEALMSASLERVAASAEEAGRSVQEAFGEMASRMNERHAA